MKLIVALERSGIGQAYAALCDCAPRSETDITHGFEP